MSAHLQVVDHTLNTINAIRYAFSNCLLDSRIDYTGEPYHPEVSVDFNPSKRHLLRGKFFFDGCGDLRVVDIFACGCPLIA